MIKLVLNEYKKMNKYKLIIMYLLLISLIYLIVYFNKNSSTSSIFETIYTLISFLGLFISILFGGIVSKEIHDGTIRMYLTKPHKRWKIIVSKLLFIYIVIISIFIVTIISYTLFINIYKHFNMTIYDIKSIFYYFSSVIFSGTFILFLSIITNSTTLSVGISSITILMSNLISQLLIMKGYKFIGYTFLSYIDLSVLRDNEYISIMKSYGVNMSLKNGIVILMLTSLFLIIFSINYFNQKDIKN